MNAQHFAFDDRDTFSENIVAEIADVAYRVALRHGLGDKWLDLQLELWKAVEQEILRVDDQPKKFTFGRQEHVASAIPAGLER